MQIEVDPDSLAGDGTALADWKASESAPVCEPASAHSVSIGVAGHLSAHSVSLDRLADHAKQVRAQGGAVTVHSAASLRLQDEANADLISGKTSTSGVASGPAALASVAAPVLPGIPPMPPLPPVSGEMHAVALHTPPGAASLRAFAESWQARAGVLDKIAAETLQTSASIDVDWRDDDERAGANTARHGNWWSDLARRARALSAAANDAADHHERWVAATPKPKEFEDARNRLAQLRADNVASHGLLSGQVSAAAARVAQLHCQAIEAAAAHHADASATTSRIPGQHRAAPPIADGSGDSPSACQCGTGNASQNTGAVGSAQQGSTTLGSNPGLAGLGTNAGAGSMNSMMQSMLPLAMMAPMMAMAPMSALSGLTGMGQQNMSRTLANNSAGWPDDAALDAGASGDLGDTFAAASGGGGSGSGAQATSLPMASSHPPPATAVSGPAASVGIPAASAGTAPASAVGGTGMSTYPPMMGGMGGGDQGGQRNVRLFPDRRVVWRPTPNTEAVFGELPRERRPRPKRAAPEREASEKGTDKEGTKSG